MKNVFKKIVLGLSFVLLLASCVSRKKMIYFQFDAIDQTRVSNSYQTLIKPDDLLQITITAQDMESVRPFNLMAVTTTAGTNTANGIPTLQNYLVDAKGEIDFPVIGKIKIGGLSRSQTIRLLKDKLSPDYVRNPNINIRITNYKISVLGDVARPGSFTVPNERITLLEALAMAGDINISGLRENVLVIREENGKKVHYRVNLLSNNVYTAPVYYLQQNDVVYVEPNAAKIQSASQNANTGLFISLTSILIALLSILTR